MDNKEAIQLLDKSLLRGNFTDRYGGSDWFNGYDTLVKMIAFKESEENEKNHFNNSRRI